jgi:hypothetical protein
MYYVDESIAPCIFHSHCNFVFLLYQTFILKKYYTHLDHVDDTSMIAAPNVGEVHYWKGKKRGIGNESAYLRE